MNNIELKVKTGYQVGRKVAFDLNKFLDTISRLKSEFSMGSKVMGAYVGREIISESNETCIILTETNSFKPYIFFIDEEEEYNQIPFSELESSVFSKYTI